MSDDIPTHRVYAQPVYHSSSDEITPLGEALAAVRNAPRDVRHEFWTNLRESIESAGFPPREDWQPRIPGPALDEVIYYVRFADRVKIGYTTNLKRRLTSLPHDAVLATEPGTMRDEKARHQQFADLRITGEWFRYEEPLTIHIASLH